MAGFPEDLLVEILLRLPLEDLLQSRCVSRRWRNLIDSPNFVKSQLNLPNKPQYVMAMAFDSKFRIYYSKLDSDYIKNPSRRFNELPVALYHEFFSNLPKFVGLCNGLLCCVRKKERTFVVLNPFTGKHFQVPPPEKQQCRWSAWGFGYDGDSDDYKVVAKPYSRNNRGTGGKIGIYSLKSGLWKSIADFPYVLNHTNGVFVNGALHWIVHCRGDSSKFICALHLGSLEYFSVPRPSDYSKKLSHLVVLDGCLYAIYSEYYEHKYYYDLWVMKEYGLEESWTRLSTYDWFYSAREVLFASYGNSLVKCEFGSDWKNYWNISHLDFVKWIGQPFVYEPSLVCPRSGI